MDVPHGPHRGARRGRAQLPHPGPNPRRIGLPAGGEHDTCERLASRAGEELRAFERRWLEAHAPALARRELPHIARPVPNGPLHRVVPSGPPLDEHTDSDRRALQRILEQRGSK